MANSKRLYFIPIITRALERGDSRRAMKQAFDEIRELGLQPEYNEGYRQFLEFARMVTMPSEKESEQKVKVIRNAVSRLVFELATGSFQGNEDQKKVLMKVINSTPELKAEYKHIVKETQSFVGDDMPLELEVLRDEKIIGSGSITTLPLSFGSVSPGRYTVRLSNGRVLWEGELVKEDVIWAFAYAGKDLAMAAKTEMHEQEPTKIILLLVGELMFMQVFAGLEAGQIRIKSGKRI